MNRKNKVMLIAAIGAVAILAASMVVRCAATNIGAGDSQGTGSALEQSQASDEPETASAMTATLQSHVWQAANDSTKTVTFRDGVFIESSSEGSVITAFEITSEKEASGGSTADIKITRDGVDPGTATTMILEGAEGSYKISCDGFKNSKTYVQGSTSSEPVTVSGVAEPYTTLIDGKTEALAEALAGYCREYVPTTTEATFGGEVYVDVNEGRVAATFHCNDSKSTLLSVTYKDGAFAVAG